MTPARVPERLRACGSCWCAYDLILCGIIIAGATLKEVVARIAESPVAIAPKRPSIGTVMVMGFLLKDAVGRIGSDALGLPAGR
jgi:hypothetical protein